MVIAVGLMAFGCARSNANSGPTKLEVHDVNGECVMLVKGDRHMPRTDEEWAEFAAKLKQAGQNEVTIYGSTRTPYRCVGAAVFALQRTGLDVGFLAEPPAQ